MDFNLISDSELLDRVSFLVKAEKKLTAEIIEFIKEVDRRKLYLGLGFTSMFDYMTRHLGYTPGSAQRRIDSARLLREIPELKQEIQAGKLNLMQLSTLARAVREKRKTSNVTTETKREILSAITSQDISQTEQTISQILDLPIQVKEIKRTQKDQSVRVEFTFSKEQYELFEKAKSLMSHVNPNPTAAQVFEYLARRFIKQKVGDESETLSHAQKMGSRTPDLQAETFKEITHNHSTPSQSEQNPTARMAVNQKPKNPRYIPPKIRKQLFQSQACCQWKTNGKICGSRFQLQIDHIQPIWADGATTSQNLQILCSTHNQLKYRLEAGFKPSSEPRVAKPSTSTLKSRAASLDRGWT